MSANFENDPEFNAAIPKPSTRTVFRLAEFLVMLVIIIGVLVGLLLPATRSARPAARRSQCALNLRQIGLALHNYEQAHGAFPPACTLDANGRSLHSWRTLILPYLEQGPLYQTIDLSKPWNDPANAKVLEAPVSAFRCPEAMGPQNTTTYLAIGSPNGCLIPGQPRRLADITDGTSMTLVVIEAGEENAVPWMAPVDADETFMMNLGPSTKLHHVGGMNSCFVDGSVRFLKANTPVPVRRALMTISGNDNDVAREW